MNLDGVSMNFAGMHTELTHRVSAKADGNDEAMVAIKNGDALHVIRSGEKCKLVLFFKGNLSGTRGLNLDSVSLEVMKKAVEIGILHVGGKELKITNSRALSKLMA